MIHFKFPLRKVFLCFVYRNSMKMKYVDLPIGLEGICLPSVHIFQFGICHLVFIKVLGTFKIPSEKIAFVKVRWKVSTRYIYYRWMIWLNGSCLSFVWSSDLRSNHFVFKRYIRYFKNPFGKVWFCINFLVKFWGNWDVCY